MKYLYKIDPWRIIEDNYNPNINEISESIMSLGNGHMGLRGNIEEDFSGPTLKGTYVAGVYYPDKTKVAWWKNGYPEYFAKVLNACDFISLTLKIDGETIDIAKTKLISFVRVLDMQIGLLSRTAEVETAEGKRVRIEARRFLSMADKEIGAVEYMVTPLDSDVDIEITPYLNGDVRNTDANYDEMFWEKEAVNASSKTLNVTMRTKKTGYVVAVSKTNHVMLENQRIVPENIITDNLYTAHVFHVKTKQNQTLTLTQYITVTTSRDYAGDAILEKSFENVKRASEAGFDALFNAHKTVWVDIWAKSDVEIIGDDAAQQGIRFNIFHLNQTYTGDDARLNIGPKGFTGEKYGGSTYWDTEVFCLPFFLATAEKQVSEGLLEYRYNHLEKAKENAKKLGMQGALYPMVTMNGEECHNEWEITFEEIHRNGAMAYAIKSFVDYTGDTTYLFARGIDVLVEIARYWMSRVLFNKRTGKYMILGVTGPNEYENNINNNWYTNYMAAFALRYASECVKTIEEKSPKQYSAAKKRLNLTSEEIAAFDQTAQDMYYPIDTKHGVFIQQDGFLDKALKTVDELMPEDRPLNQTWSWDRILRSCYIKQADVLQGIFNFPDEFDIETKRRNFDFYEPMTVHESSLSPSVHSVLASEIGYTDKAYALYLRASRLDLDNYNNDTEDGLHITSMTGSWLAIVHGFGGLRIKDGRISLKPILPDAWRGYAFRLYYRGTTFKVNVTNDSVIIENENGGRLTIDVFGTRYHIDMGGQETISCNG